MFQPLNIYSLNVIGRNYPKLQVYWLHGVNFLTDDIIVFYYCVHCLQTFKQSERFTVQRICGFMGNSGWLLSLTLP